MMDKCQESTAPEAPELLKILTKAVKAGVSGSVMASDVLNAVSITHGPMRLARLISDSYDNNYRSAIIEVRAGASEAVVAELHVEYNLNDGEDAGKVNSEDAGKVNSQGAGKVNSQGAGKVNSKGAGKVNWDTDSGDEWAPVRIGYLHRVSTEEDKAIYCGADDEQCPLPSTPTDAQMSIGMMMDKCASMDSDEARSIYTRLEVLTTAGGFLREADADPRVIRSKSITKRALRLVYEILETHRDENPLSWMMSSQ